MKTSMKKKSKATKKNPSGQMPKPAGNFQGHKKQMKSKTPMGMPVKNFST